MDLPDLLAAVAARYDRLGLPTWPDPHPGLASPREEEYSRVTEPDRYRIVPARAAAWVDALVEELGAVATSDAGATRVTSPRPGTLSLLLVAEDAALEQQGHLPLVRVAVADPTMEIARHPDCGCDACDSGSEDLLEAIDSAIASVVVGPFVAMNGDGWHARWHPEGGSASGGGDIADFGNLMELCRRIAAGEPVDPPPDALVALGRSWLG